MDTDYRLIAESAEDSIFTVNRDLIVTYVNAHGAGMLGGSPEMVVGQNLKDLFPPASIKKQAPHIERVFETGKPSYAENQYTFGDREIWLGTRLIPIRSKKGTVEAVMGFSRDITGTKAAEKDLKENERKLQQRLKYAAALNELGGLLIGPENLDDLLGKMTEGIGRALDVDRALIYHIDFKKETINGLAEWINSEAPKIGTAKGQYAVDEFLGGALEPWRTKEPFISHFDRVNPALVKDGSSEVLHGQIGIKSLLCYPFNFQKHGLYALTLYCARSRCDWSDDEIKMAATITRQLTAALQKIELTKEKKAADEEVRSSLKRLEKTLEETIEALAATAEKKDPTTAGHQQRVVKLALAIAKELNLSKEKTEGVRIAGTVHDIGKIYIPVEILSKPGTLNDLEFGMVQTHSQFGFDILKTVDFPWPIAKIVIQHHERLDGSGYPLGLKGDEICQEARILAVADVVEAMLSHRPYRARLERKDVLEELEKGRGVLYDEDVAAACIKLLKSKTFVLD
ncbi:MAG: HD domain-containing phosphohydrolase [Actinomycetota bacterium]